MRYSVWAATGLILGGWFSPPPAAASDSASLQFTVPAPDPVQAGETVSFQALAVNTGAGAWAKGSYYWVAEVYDLEYRFLARSKEESPKEDVAPGGVAAISLPFSIPPDMVGRKLYRVFLIKGSQTLVQSEYKPFQVLAKDLPPPPPPAEVVEYRLEGNVTVSMKNTTLDKGKKPTGSTNINVVGKIKASSYLINAYLIHEPGKVVDPYTVLFTYYAPWGRIYAGDVSPTLSPLSVSGQGMRGLMLEQSKGAFDWSILGGQTVTSQAGTATVDGRFSRSLYAGRAGAQLPGRLKLALTAFLSSDDPGSLSSNPNSSNYKGPTLEPQKNRGLGTSLAWEPLPELSWLLDYQKNDYYADSGANKVSDNAWKGEVRWSRKLFKLRASVQRAGPNFVAFSAPNIIGDRLTYDGSLNLYPAKWYSLSANFNQYRDNLANDPDRVTITQRTATVGNALSFKSGTSANISGSLNTARGDPATALDNQTTTFGADVSQSFGKHMVSVNGQAVAFRDKNGVSHDLDTKTFGLSTNLGFPWKWRTSLGGSRTQTKDKADGSQRTSLSLSASCAIPLGQKWKSQYWGSLTQTKNNSPLSPSDVKTTSVNSEYTWTPNKSSTLAFGPGYNENKDKYYGTNSHHEWTMAMRYTYSF